MGHSVGRTVIVHKDKFALRTRPMYRYPDAGF